MSWYSLKHTELKPESYYCFAEGGGEKVNL
jgi:hypothetical protein